MLHKESKMSSTDPSSSHVDAVDADTDTLQPLPFETTEVPHAAVVSHGGEFGCSLLSPPANGQQHDEQGRHMDERDFRDHDEPFIMDMTDSTVQESLNTIIHHLDQILHDMITEPSASLVDGRTSQEMKVNVVLPCDQQSRCTSPLLQQ